MAAVVAVGIVATVGILLAGPIEVGPPRFVPGVAHPTRLLPTPAGMPGQFTPPGRPNPIVQDLLRIAAMVLLALAAALLLFIVVRTVRRLLRHRRHLIRRQAPGRSVVAGRIADASQAVDAAPAVRHGISRALEILDEARPPGDAVVAAWLGLEDAACGGGTRRHAWETPSEFAARVIARFDTDREAADALLRLYQDVRFGAWPATAQTVRTARDCLLRLQASWHEESLVPETER